MPQHVRNVVGVPEEVRNVLVATRNKGLLVDVLPPVLLPDGRISVRTLVKDPEPKHRKVPSGLLIGAVLTVGLAGAGAILVAAVMAVASLISWVVAHIVAIGAVIAVAILLPILLAGGSGCSGLHCSGCGR